MPLRKLHDTWKTLSFRLALWYTAIFTVSSILAFTICYLMIASVLRDLTDEELLEEHQEFRSSFQKGGLEMLSQELRGENESEDIEELFMRIFTTEGELISSTDLSSWKNLGLNRDALKEINQGAESVFEISSVPGKEYKVRSIYGKIGSEMVFNFGMSLESEREFLGVFERIFFIALVIMMIVATIVGWFMSRRALAGVEEVARTAIDIRNGSLEKRVPLKSRGLEIETLAMTFNEMLDHIEALIREMRQLTDNIAHDLRNPITSLRGKAELAITSGASDEEWESITAGTVEECDRLLQMINSMLDLAEADSGALKLKLEEIEISQLVEDAVEIFEPLAEEKDITIINKVPDGLKAKVDRHSLQRLISNLIDNAVKYTLERGEVVLSANIKSDVIEIMVEDTGIGISEDELPLIFNRHYRSDKSRSSRGIGLGLSLARAIARSHQGDLLVKSMLNKGSVFTVILPTN